MKRFHKYILGGSFAFLALALTSCEDETFPTSIATQDQASASPAATKSLVYAMPAYFNHIDEDLIDNNSWHGAFGYSAIMIMRDLQTNDRTIGQNYSSHFRYYAYDKYMGKRYVYASYPWSYYYGLVLTANKTLAAIDINDCSDDLKGYYGQGLAFRALAYLDLARTYEFLPNEKFSSSNENGKDVTGLTVPIVTDTLSESTARNNPRATREEMAKFIENDLNQAEEYIKYASDFSDGTLPDYACVEGLKARLYMWIGDYEKASKYAQEAIENSAVSPMTEEACLDTKKGFNDISKWMWGAKQTSEDDAVQTGIVNWTSWASNENSFGYAGVGAYNLIDADLYSKISDTDFRKKEFYGPNGAVEGQQFCTTTGFTSDGSSLSFETVFRAYNAYYASLKFRPNEGNADAYQTGAASAYPIMRVEEMYFIWAEAEAHLNAAKGKQLIEDIMKNKLARDPEYVCNASNTDDVVNEIVLQKRIELWGEGQTFFDVKRLNLSVDRTYEGSNWLPLAQFKTNGRPAWMNWVIPQNEEKNNSALADYNNPDPSDAYAK